MRDVPGFQQFRRSDARSANPTSQGATLRALGGNASSRALLILDGVPQTDPFGGWISWPAYDPRRLGRVRVMRGGGSGANGPGALAGTIELDSAAPDELGGPRPALAYGSRDSIDAFAGARRCRSAAASLSRLGRLCARRRLHPDRRASSAAPADRPSPYRQASLAVRAVAPLVARRSSCRPMSRPSPTRASAAPRSATIGTQRRRRLAAAGRPRPPALRRARLCPGPRFRQPLRRGRAPTAPTATQTLDQYSVPVDRPRRARRGRARALGPVELRLGADWRETEGRTQELFQFVAGAPTRGRVAGGRTRTLGAFAEAGWESGAAHPDRRRPARPLADRGRPPARAHARHRRAADRHRLPRPRRLGADRPGRRSPGAPRAALTLRAAAYLGWRLPTLNELYRPFRVGADATAANAALAPERLEGVEAGLELRPAPGARIGVTLFANRLDDAIANVTLGQGPGVFPGVGFVAAGGAVPPAPESRRDRQPRRRDRRQPRRSAAGASPPATASPTPRSRRAAPRCRSTACARRRRRATAPPRRLAWQRRARRPRRARRRATSAANMRTTSTASCIPDALTFDAAAALPLAAAPRARGARRESHRRAGRRRHLRRRHRRAGDAAHASGSGLRWRRLRFASIQRAPNATRSAASISSLRASPTSPRDAGRAPDRP